MRLINLSTLFACGMLAACSTQIPDIVPVTNVPVVIPEIQQVALAPVHWQVLNQDDLKALATKEAKNGDFVLFGLSESDYKNMMANWIETKRYVIEQNSALDMAKTVINSRQKAVK